MNPLDRVPVVPSGFVIITLYVPAGTPLKLGYASVLEFKGGLLTVILAPETVFESVTVNSCWRVVPVVSMVSLPDHIFAPVPVARGMAETVVIVIDPVVPDEVVVVVVTEEVDP